MGEETECKNDLAVEVNGDDQAIGVAANVEHEDATAALHFDDVGGGISCAKLGNVGPCRSADHGNPRRQIPSCFRIFDRFPFQVRFFNDPHAYNLYAWVDLVKYKARTVSGSTRWKRPSC